MYSFVSEILCTNSISIPNESFFLRYKYVYLSSLMMTYRSLVDLLTIESKYIHNECFASNLVSKTKYQNYNTFNEVLHSASNDTCTHSPIVKHMASGWQGEGWHMEVGVLLLVVASLITGTV